MTDAEIITFPLLAIHLNRLEGQANAIRISLRAIRKTDAAKPIDGQLLIVQELIDEIYEELGILAERVKQRLAANDR